MLKLNNFFKNLLSIRFFIISCLTTWFFFQFLDIEIFKYSRNFNANYFYFFEKIIDPISDILDPLNILIISMIFLVISSSLKKKINEPRKFKILFKEIRENKQVLLNSIDFYSLIFWHCISSILLSGIVCHLIKYILGVSRPKYYFMGGYERLDFFNIEHKVNSLPSGHTQAIFTIAALFLLYFNRFFLIVYLTACLVGLSRIFMSMHFPSDLIFGAYIGTFFPIWLYKVIYLEKLKKLTKEKIFSFRRFLKLIYLRLII